MKDCMRANLWRVYLTVAVMTVVGFFLPPDSWWQMGTGAAIGLAAVAGLLVGSGCTGHAARAVVDAGRRAVPHRSMRPSWPSASVCFPGCS